MNGVVLNKQIDAFDWGWESLALRASIALMDTTHSVGDSPHLIMYMNNPESISTKNKLKLLIDHETDPEFKKSLMQAQTILQMLHRRKHPSKQDIVFLKQHDAMVNKLFDEYRKTMMDWLKGFGLPQLKTLYTDEERLLHLWALSGGLGEKNGSAPLSYLLSQKVEDEDDPAADVYIFFEAPGKELFEKKNLVHLATLPNLNFLEPEKLRNVHDRLRPMQQELDALLPLLPAQESGPAYHTGYWNLDGVKAFAPRLQQALHDTPELQWAKNINSNMSVELHVGNMETTELWQFLRDKGLVPDDTWQVLSKNLQDGDCCPTSAIMTLTSDWATNGFNSLTEEETHTHKRKTIDLD